MCKNCNDIQLIFLQEGVTGILLREPKSFVSCSHMNCCLQKYTMDQFTYSVYYVFQDKFKNPKIIKIQQIHQKIHTKQFYYFV